MATPHHAPLCGPDTEQRNRDSPGAPFGATYQRNGRECLGGGGVRMGQTGRSRALEGERPIGTAGYTGKGFKESRRVSGERPIGAANFGHRSTQASWLSLKKRIERERECVCVCVEGVGDHLVQWCASGCRLVRAVCDAERLRGRQPTHKCGRVPARRACNGKDSRQGAQREWTECTPGARARRGGQKLQARPTLDRSQQAEKKCVRVRVCVSLCVHGRCKRAARTHSVSLPTPAVLR